MNYALPSKKIKRALLVFLLLVGFMLLLFLLRFKIAQGLSSFLIVAYTPTPSEAIFVLSGNAYERAQYAVNLIRNGVSNNVLCTGGNKDANAIILGKDYYECELTRLALQHFGVDSLIKADTLCRGTSTFEECENIFSFCREKNWKHITIVSSAFHTRRIKMTCRKVFNDSDIIVDIAPAPPRNYNVKEWWKSEYGLIDLNNEYVKLFYYLLK